MKLGELLNKFEGDDEFLSKKARIDVTNETLKPLYQGSASDTPIELYNEKVDTFFIVNGHLVITLKRR